MTYAELEDAILTALEPLKTDPGVRTLDSYGGQFSEEVLRAGQMLVNYPAILVYIERLSSAEFDMCNDMVEVQVSIFMADRNLRGEKAARRGDSGSDHPGVYRLLEKAREALNGASVPGFDDCLVLTEEALWFYSAQTATCVARAVYRARTLVRKPW